MNTECSVLKMAQRKLHSFFTREVSSTSAPSELQCGSQSPINEVSLEVGDDCESLREEDVESLTELPGISSCNSVPCECQCCIDIAIPLDVYTV